MVAKAIGSAQRNVQRARARLTRWQYNALQARRDLVSGLFGLNHDIVYVSRSLLALLRQQEADPQVSAFTAEIAHYRGVEEEWTNEPVVWTSRGGGGGL